MAFKFLDRIVYVFNLQRIIYEINDLLILILVLDFWVR